MTIADMLNNMNSFLEGYAENYAGHSLIVPDVVHLWGQLMGGPQALMILLMFNGEKARVNFPGGSLTGRVDRRFLVAVSRGRSLNVLRGDTLTNPTPAGDTPLFTVVEGVRDLIRSFNFVGTPTDENPVDYDGILPFPSPQGILTDAFQIEFSIGIDIGNQPNQNPISATLP